MNAVRTNAVALAAQTVLSVAAAAVWLSGQITTRRARVALVVAIVVAVSVLAVIWLAAAVLGYFLSPTGCAWILGIGPCS